LRGLKDRVENLTALVSMTDDGGSTGVLRDELGVLPPGDVRQCLVALSDAPEELRNLFNYRFENGGLEGHSFGNLFLSAVEKTTSSFGDAVRVASDVLRIKGRVLPVTSDNVRLSATLGDGSVINGQHALDTSKLLRGNKRPVLHLNPRAAITREAKQALKAADVIVIAPGDIYTSLGPLLIVDGVSEVLQSANATVIYICNLVTKPGHTDGFTVSDHAAEIERFAGGDVIDCVLYNTAAPDPALFKSYKREGELPVCADKQVLAGARYQAVGKPLLAPGAVAPHPSDAIAGVRSFIRHDSRAVADALFTL
jgi:uncharacterized cofD-like protein